MEPYPMNGVENFQNNTLKEKVCQMSESIGCWNM